MSKKRDTLQVIRPRRGKTLERNQAKARLTGASPGALHPGRTRAVRFLPRV